MQKLEQRNTYTPTDAPQVRGNCDLSLNRDESLSVSGLKTCSNNLEVDQRHANSQDLPSQVFVININGDPIMPTKPSRARKMVESGRAKVVKLYPFTIKLNFVCENVVQDVTLGVDTGYKNIGFSCVTAKKELISGTLILDCKTSERLTEKRMYRRGRRNRHHWYRKPRFLNRKIKEGWLPPSVQRRYDTHLNLINRLKSVLPISKIIIEIANFDIQKIENPDINGVEYQQGDMYGYQNIRSYLMAREHGLCQLCGKEFSKGNTSHVHHCKPRREAGSNRPKNLALLHEKCHTKLHSKGLKIKAPKQYKPNIFMSIIHKRFWLDIPDLQVTYGYITFLKRLEFNIQKSHNNDAFVIANGSTQERCNPVIINQKHRNNRAIQLNRKGFKPAIRKQRYSIQPKDIVWINGKKFTTSGVHNKGKSVILAENKKSIPVAKISKFYNFGGLAWAV